MSHATPDAAGGQRLTLPLLDINELGRVLGLSPATIYTRRSLGRDLPPVTRVGRQLRWAPDDVAAWLEGLKEPASDSTATEPQLTSAGS